MERLKEHKKEILLVVVFVFLGAVVLFSQNREMEEMLQNGLKREEAGGEENTYTYEYRVGGGEKKTLDITVRPRLLTQNEVMDVLKKAREEWEEGWLGDNTSAAEVGSNLYFPETLQDGLVEVEYQLSDYDILNAFGEIEEDELTSEGKNVTVTALMSCQDVELPVEKFVTLKRQKKQGEEVVEEQVKETVALEESGSRTKDTFHLPESVDGKPVTWSVKESRTGWVFVLLGILCALLVSFRQREQEKQILKKKETQLLHTYPQMVDQMALLLEGGMSIRGAWERMTAAYVRMRKEKRIEEKIYLEEMLITWREICDGRGERECYERFGSRTGLPCYRRFSSILSQNLSRGSENMKRILDEEAQDARIERLHRARRLGEEAGSKLLGPMFLMFVIILGIVILPAMFQF